MLPNNFRNKMLIVASKDDANSAEIKDMSEKANTTLLQPHEFLKAQIDTSDYDGVWIFTSDFLSDANTKFLSLGNFTKCFKCIQLGGSLTIKCLLKSTNQEELVKDIEKQCMYAGFVSPEVVCAEPLNNGNFLIKLLCKKPEWTSGAAAVAKLDADDDLELVDESTLIDETEKYQKMGTGKESCASKPRACANCTCGRKEKEEKEQREEDEEKRKKMLEEGAIRSSCGNCYLGDAYRCKGCPYAGLPAFRPGDKVQLDMQRNNMGVVSVETGAATSTGTDSIGVTSDGKIKLKV